MGRPRVIVYAEASLDGRITVAPDVLLLYGDERWPTAGESNGQERLLRLHQPQAMLEGSGSFVSDKSEVEPLPCWTGPNPPRRDFVPPDIAARPGFRGWFVVVDGRGRVRWFYTGEPGKEAPGSEGWHLLVLVAGQTPREYLAYLEQEHVPYLVTGGDQVDLGQALVKLATLGVETVLVTSPGKLGGALLRAGLVDEIDVDFLPAVIGGTGTPSLFQSPDLGPCQQPQALRLLSFETDPRGRVFLRYEVATQAAQR